jgi:hypothetical protein
VGAFLLRSHLHGQNAAVPARFHRALDGNQANRRGVIPLANPDLSGIDIATCSLARVPFRGAALLAVAA